MGIPERSPLVESTIARRIALFGSTGAGKGTVAKYLAEYVSFNTPGKECHILHLASPLYQVQDLVYSLAGHPLNDNQKQDGALLNFLGGHFRKINPTSLLDVLAAKVRQSTPEAVLIVDDARPADAEGLRSLGFHLAVVDTKQNTIKRREGRGDLHLGDRHHPTEAGLELVNFDEVIRNFGTLENLRVQARRLAELWL